MSNPWHNQPWPRALFTSIQFLTRLPVPGGTTRDLSTFPEDIVRGLGFFPWIGAAVGLISAVVVIGAARIFPLPLAILVALAVETVVTGAFHEDAVADFFDAFGGGWTREDILRILKDSRVGSFGTAGLFFALGLRAAGLTALETSIYVAAGMIASGAIGRLSILVAMRLIPPVPAREGLAKDVGLLADNRSLRIGCFGTIVAVLPLLLVLSPLNLLARLTVIALLIGAFLLWFRRYLMRRLGGITGDCLGTVAYAGMLITILGLAAH